MHSKSKTWENLITVKINISWLYFCGISVQYVYFYNWIVPRCDCNKNYYYLPLLIKLLFYISGILCYITNDYLICLRLIMVMMMLTYDDDYHNIFLHHHTSCFICFSTSIHEYNVSLICLWLSVFSIERTHDEE